MRLQGEVGVCPALLQTLVVARRHMHSRTRLVSGLAARGHAGTRSAKTDILVAAASSNPDKTLLLFPEKSSVDITSITDVDATLEREGLVSRVRLDMGKAGGTDKETDTHTRRDKRAANGPNSWTVILIDGSWRQVIVAL